MRLAEGLGRLPGLVHIVDDYARERCCRVLGVVRAAGLCPGTCWVQLRRGSGDHRRGGVGKGCAHLLVWELLAITWERAGA